MSDAVDRLNAALEGRYAIERQLGEGGMATVYVILPPSLRHSTYNEASSLVASCRRA